MSKMMANQLMDALVYAVQENGGVPVIRTNYETETLASLFGAKSVIVGNNMPWVEHLGLDEIKKLVTKGEVTIENGFGAKVIETYEFYKNELANYPNAKEKLKLYHPDLQGPFDVSHLLWGSDIYIAIYDDPALVKGLMQLVTDTYIKFMDKIKTVIDDSSVNLSEDNYVEFVMAYNEQIFDYYNTLNIAIKQVRQYKKYLYMPQEKIMAHIYNDKFKVNNQIAWGRANGWVLRALRELLLVMPNDNEFYVEIKEFFNELCDGISNYQDESGMWHQVINDSQSYLESSCTCMFISAFLMGAKNNWLDNAKGYSEMSN